MEISIDVGGTKTTFALFKKKFFKREFVSSKTIETMKGNYFLLHHLENLDLFLKECNLSIKNIKKIGYSIAGPVKNNNILNLPNISKENFDLKYELSSFFDKKLNVNIKNDANAFVLGIKRNFFPKNKFKKMSFLGVTLGTGIGCGYITENKLLEGNIGRFGEIAHFKLEKRTFEDFLPSLELSNPFFRNFLLENSINSLKEFYLFFIEKKAKNSINEKNIEILKYFFKHFYNSIDQIIENLNNTYDPSFMIFGGSISHLFYLDERFNISYLIGRQNLIKSLEEITKKGRRLKKSSIVKNSLDSSFKKQKIIEKNFKGKIDYNDNLIFYTTKNYNLLGALLD